jgi:pSer/pThr/pTyr-binding forkhead associated (FHA) protein
MLGLLQITHGPDKGKTFALTRNAKELIGRGPNNSICLSDPQVSRLHCQVKVEGNKVLLTDAGSVGGTWVNGDRVTQHELQTGDVIRIGETQFAFRWADTDEKGTETWSHEEKE